MIASIPSAYSSALSGMQRHLALFDQAAQRLSQNEVSCDTARDMMEMKTAKHGVALHAAVLKRVDEMTGTLIDILA